jgi:hypothetical protein
MDCALRKDGLEHFFYATGLTPPRSISHMFILILGYLINLKVLGI